VITLVFTAWHMPKATGRDPFNAGLMVVEVFLFGLFLGWLRRRSGTTTAPIVAHITLNVIPPLYPVLVGAIFAGHLFGG